MKQEGIKATDITRNIALRNIGSNREKGIKRILTMITEIERRITRTSSR